MQGQRANIVFYGGLALAAVIFTSMALFGLRMSPVASGSMEPAYLTGSLAVAHNIDTADLKVGDVAIFAEPNGDRRIMHRVHSIERQQADEVVFTSKGDANPLPDAWTVVERGETVRIATASVPYLGYVVSYFRQPVLIIGTIGLLLLFAFWHLRSEQQERRAAVTSTKAATPQR